MSGLRRTGGMPSALRLDDRFRWGLYGILSVLFVTGSVWLIADALKDSPSGDFWQGISASLLMIHGGAALDSRAKCYRALREPDLHVFAKLFEDCLKRSLEAQAFSGREIGGDDDVLDFLVGHFVDVDLTRQPAS